MKLIRKSFTFATLALLGAAPLRAQNIAFTPAHPSGIYNVDEPVRWTARAADAARAGKYSYTIKKNDAEVIKSGEVDLTSGPATIESALHEPGMLYLELKPESSKPVSLPPSRPIAAGAAVAPTQLKPVAPRPADFDQFWAHKIKSLEAIPANPKLTPGDSGKPDVEYDTIQMDHVNNTHVYGQLAKPKREGKFPAVVIFQWASPPYPLQKSWVTDRAAEGWLALNIEPHDVQCDQPPSYYAALPDHLKHYERVGDDDRDKSYFVEMYLRDYRAVDYLASRPDWDGKTLVVMGTSMGGQQSFAVAGLHPKITHLIVDVPAGCDTNGPLHGRGITYPDLPPDDVKVMQTALYIDPINFVVKIKAKCLVAMGFVDTLTQPVGIWTAFNEISAPKEVVPLIRSPHNHLARGDEQAAIQKRTAEWLNTLVKGGDVTPSTHGADVESSTPTQPATQPAAQLDEHQNMMDQLGVKSIRPGPDPKNQATFDEASANRYKDSMPNVLKMNDGTAVTRADQWPARQAEIVEDFEREVYGRIPKNVPSVQWEIKATKRSETGGVAIITRDLIGHVDNSAYPSISVNIEASVTVPAAATKPVPTIIAFTFSFPQRPGAPPFHFPTPPGVPWTQQAITHGWGYATFNTSTVQPDNDHLTTGGIIGLTNKGEPRKPDDWGVLRAWQWGASRLIDCFEAHPEFSVDSTKVGIEGLSRWGKAAIVTEAFEPRIAVGLVGSSGEGGAKLHRHIFGEAVENLAGGEYYWMAGNFIKYGASDPPKTAADLPVDSHELIALCAPRPCFISHGIPAKGDANWIDAHGSFMAAVLASPVYELLGAKGLDVKEDYLTAKMPLTLTLVGNQLAWRQHEGGHDVTPNWPAFFDWVARYIPSTPPVART